VTFGERPDLFMLTLVMKGSPVRFRASALRFAGLLPFASECTSSTRTQNGHTGGSDLRASGTDELLGGDPIIRVELIEEVGVCAERHRRRVAGLPCDNWLAGERSWR
jgi:hypothetical protein